MSYNRLNYDKCAYTLKLKRSITPGNYRLFTGLNENNKQCLSLNAPINSNNGASSVRRPNETDFGLLINAESHLTNRTILNSNCNINSTDQEYKNLDVYHKQLCDKNIETIDSRFTHPVDSYRGISTIDFNINPYLHVNPQHNIICDSHREGFYTRTWFKDNFKIPKHSGWDADTSLPTKNKTKKAFRPLKHKCVN